MEHFRSLVEVLEHYGANIGEDEVFIKEAEKLIDEFPPDVNDHDYKTYLVKVAKYRDKCKKAVRNRTLALTFLKGADMRLYGNLWVELENQFTRQHDQYPIDLTAAYNMLLNYKSTAPVQGTDGGDALGGLSFLQRGGVTVPGSDGITHARITCYTCNNKGHYAGDCPDAAPEGGPPAVPKNEPAIHMLQQEEIESDSDGDDSGQSNYTFNQNSGHGMIPSS